MWGFRGNPDQLLERANEIASGKTTEPPANAETVYLKCVDKGMLKAKAILGFHYVFGTFGEAKSEAGRKLLEAAASDNDASACVHLGLAHAKGRFGNVNYDAAYTCYEQAAALGDGAAMFNMGVMLVKGQGREVDILSARTVFEKALSAGVNNAATMIAFCDGLIHQIRQDALFAQALGKEYEPNFPDKAQAGYDVSCLRPFLQNERALQALSIAHSDNRVSLGDVQQVKAVSIHVNNLAFHTGIPRHVIIESVIGKDLSKIDEFIADMTLPD